MIWSGIVFLCVCLASVYSIPYSLLTSTRSRCFTVVSPPGEELIVRYNVPDLILPEDEADALDKPPPIPDEQNPDGMDAYYSRRDRANHERMTGNKMSDMSITVFQRNQASVAKERRSPDGTVRAQGRVREELTKKEGFINFTSSDDGGDSVEICVASMTASVNRPVRFHLNVVTSEWLLLGITSKTEEDAKKERDEVAAAVEFQAQEAKQSMTRLERDMSTFTRRVKSILDRADVNKDQEVSFHDQSIAMNRAASYWPIIRLVFLFLTGFAQVNHIIQFMKSRRI